MNQKEAQSVDTNTTSEIITDVPKEQYTQDKFNMNTLVTKVPQKYRPANLDSAFEVQDTFDDYALQRNELDEYEQETGRRIVDYSYNSSRTFSNTGTPLDGKTVDEVANSKDATPNQIFEMKDLLEQIAYGSYEVWRNLSKMGLWGGIKVAEMVTGSDIELSEEEKQHITWETLEKHLYTAGMPDPDLIVRTSGEQRLSNYLLLQAAYSEFYFPSTYGPDFDDEAFDKAIDEYKRRTRRFGGI